MTEREVMWTGIGGQGVQLAAKTLAQAAIDEAREVQSLGTYGGTMRGGNTDATVVIAQGPIVAPPIVSRAWSAVVVHPRYFEPLGEKLREGGWALVDADLLEEPEPAWPEKVEIVRVSATSIAREVDAGKAAALVLLGAFASATGIVSLESVESAFADSLPSYRQDSLEPNLRALRAGSEAVPALAYPAWPSEGK